MRIAIPAVLALALSLTMGFAQSTRAAAVPSHEVRATDVRYGSVVAASGEVISGARVSVYLEGSAESVATARTGNDGSYKISVPAGTQRYTVRVLCIGFQPVVKSVLSSETPVITMQPIATDPAV